MLWDQSSCVTMSIVWELGLVWDATRTHFMAFGRVDGLDVWARPCQMVEKANPSEPKILPLSCAEWLSEFDGTCEGVREVGVCGMESVDEVV